MTWTEAHTRAANAQFAIIDMLSRDVKEAIWDGRIDPISLLNTAELCGGSFNKLVQVCRNYLAARSPIPDVRL